MDDNLSAWLRGVLPDAPSKDVAKYVASLGSYGARRPRQIGQLRTEELVCGS